MKGKSQGDGGLLISASCCAHVGGAPQVHQQQRVRTSGCWWRSPGRWRVSPRPRPTGSPNPQTVTQFDTDEYRIIVVAEKFQTGFDQPKLVAMYVDKTLSGLATQCRPCHASTGPTPTRTGHVRSRLRQRHRRHPRRLRRLPRQDRGAPHRSQPAVRYPRRTEQLPHLGPGPRCNKPPDSSGKGLFGNEWGVGICQGELESTRK